jgi:hypothetical protein
MMMTMAAPLIAMIPMACRRRKSSLMLLKGQSRTCHHFIVMHSPSSQPGDESQGDCRQKPAHVRLL